MTSPQAGDYWKLCSSCKKPIGFSTTYWVCSVSTCNRKRFPLFFCTVACWDAHVPGERHRESWAVEKKSPTRAQAEAEANEAKADVDAGSAGVATEPSGIVPREVLIVASRFDDYLAGLCGAPIKVGPRALHALSERLRALCDEAIAKARKDGRKTVMERDFVAPREAKAAEVLVIASRLKDYIRAAAGMNTANAVVELVSAHLRAWASEASRRLLRDERVVLEAKDVEG